MALKRQRNDEPKENRWLEVDASMTGTMAFKDPVNLRINGCFEGTLDTKGSLSVGDRAEVKANIQGELITIGGSVKGNITASQRVELLANARVIGKIKCPRIVMRDGAILQGTLDMMSAGLQDNWMNVESLARYLEVDEPTIVQWAQDGRLPSQRDGNEWRFERDKVEKWLAQEKIK